MKINTILDHIDNGHMALPEFQRGYVWNREQVRGLFDSLYKRHPVGGLLVWATESNSASTRGDGQIAAGVVKLLLDGQQRMTSLYGVVRGRAPSFFDGNAQAFTGLRFSLMDEVFEFYQPVKMRDDPLWIDVSELFKRGNNGLGSFIAQISQNPDLAAKVGEFASRLARLLAILEIDLHIEEITGADKSLDVVVDIFNRVNSGGTKLSKGDLALAKICAEWPDARDTMRSSISRWHENGYDFNLDWLLRSVNTVLTGEAKFQYLHDKSADEVRGGLKKAVKGIDQALNMIADRVGLDHDRVLFGRFGIPVMVNLLTRRTDGLNEKERDKLLFWFVSAGMWGRFSGSTESMIDQDLNVVEQLEGAIDRLLEQLRLWNGGFLRVETGHFAGWSLGARFYPVLYMLTRVGEARDWGSGLKLRSNLLGKMSRLEVHHIFPKAQLYKLKHSRPEVNALANFCFQTKDTNLQISDTRPEVYFPEIETRHPGALASQWIPMDERLWKLENYGEFLEARKALLVNETNRFLAELLHGDDRWLAAGDAPSKQIASSAVPGGIESEDEEQELEALNDWVADQGLPRGEIAFDLANPETGTQEAILDLAWPLGLQAGLSDPVALLLNEPAEVIDIASSRGFRCFTTAEKFKHYVSVEILSGVR